MTSSSQQHEAPLTTGPCGSSLEYSERVEWLARGQGCTETARLDEYGNHLVLADEVVTARLLRSHGQRHCSGDRVERSSVANEPTFSAERLQFFEDWTSRGVYPV